MENSVLVTGAGGFIGSGVVRRLLKGVEDGTLMFADGSHVKHVVALVRQSTSLERLQELVVSSKWSVEFADITDQIELQVVLEKTRPKVIMHLALESAVFSDMTELETQKHNEAPLETMFEYLSGISESRLIHTGSAWVLGSGINLAEDAPVNIQSAYARTKLRTDDLLPVLKKKTGVDWINLRIFNVYGKYESQTRLLPYLVSHLPQGKVAKLSHGNQIRDFNNVDDVAESYVLAMLADRNACGQIYHIGTGVGFTTKEFATIVAEVTGNAELIDYGSIKSPDQDLPELVANPSLARMKLGWLPPERPQERIKEAARWWLEYYARS